MEKLQKIYQWPFKLGYGEKIKFESKYSLDESVEKLKTLTMKWHFLLAFALVFSPNSRIAGKISKDSVKIVRAQPFIFSIPGKPYFFGKFVKYSDRNILDIVSMLIHTGVKNPKLSNSFN